MATERPGHQTDGAAPPLLVRTRRSDHKLTWTGGTDYRIGRDPRSHIVLDDSRVSWRHAVLRLDGGSWVLVDCGSTNGTFLGTRRVDRVEITADCVIRLGNPEDGPLLRCMPDQQLAVGRPAVGKSAVGKPAAGGSAAGSEPAGQAGGPAGPVKKSDGQVRGAAWQADQRPSQADQRPSVDRRPTMRLPLPARVMRIGRTPDNDLVLSDLGVSRHHAELRKSSSGAYQIIDLDSHNGVFLNGHKIDKAELTEADIISIGRATFRLADGELRQFNDTGDISLAARDLVVRVGGGKILLDNVSFPIPERCLLGVIGPSGAGKSTLLGALTGMRPADSGTVLYDNRDLYKDYAELRHRIGLVPQDSIMHTLLTARRALRYSAELRFPSDTRRAERNQRVDEVMTELGLARHADTRADRLSGGQLKRVNVALELLTKPSLLFLDEPTSGLDPGLDKSVMEQMRDLAHDGRTVIVVTHSVANLDACDRLLVLVPGGKVAYYGPPRDGLAYFGQPGWAEVFQAFDTLPGRDWAGEFARSRECAQYVRSAGGRNGTPAARPGASRQVPPPPPARRGRIRQISTLSRRYLRVIAADRGYLAFMGLLPVLLGVLIRLVSSAQGLTGPPGTNNNAEELLLMLVISACLAGAANSVRELVKERPIYVRERAAGQSSGAYLCSKLLVLGLITMVQSVLLVGIGLATRPLPASGSALTGLPLVELLVGMAVLGLASMCLGLAISAFVSTSEKAMPILVLATMVQVILSGGVIPLVGKAGLAQVAWIAPSRWGFGAVASTANLNVIAPMGGNADPLWRHDAKTWLMDMGLQLALALVFLTVAKWKLGRLSPGRRR